MLMGRTLYLFDRGVTMETQGLPFLQGLSRDNEYVTLPARMQREFSEEQEVHWLEFLVLVKPSMRSTLGMECSFESCFPQHPSRLSFSVSPYSLSLPHFCKLCSSEPSKERVMEDDLCRLTGVGAFNIHSQ